MADLADNTDALDPFGRIGGRKSAGALDAERREHFARTIRNELPLFVKVHQAWLVMLARTRIVEKERARKIMDALNGIGEEAIDEMIATWTPSSWEPMIQLERYLTSRAGQAASDLNIGRTIPPPFYRMEILPLLTDLMDEVLDFLQVLLEKAAENLETVMPGYTHLQHAQPMTYGHYLVGLFDAVLRAYQQLEAAYAATNRFELGCGAMAGTSFAIDRELPARLLAFDGIVEHSNDAVAATDFIVDVLAALINLMTPVGRVANDLDIWSSFEFGMVEVADEICNPSSMMPQKKNPALFEFCRMSLGAMLGGLAEVVCGTHATPYGDVIEMRELAFSTHPRIGEATKQIRVMRQAIGTLIVKKGRMLELARKGFSTATELAAVLYREAGMPLRMAHGIVAETVRKLAGEGRQPDDITPELIAEISQCVTGTAVRLSRDRLSASIDPVEFVKAHGSVGGVSPTSVQRMLDTRGPRLAESRQRQQQRAERRARADDELAREVERLLRG
jgi:argininosuccinate lyase